MSNSKLFSDRFLERESLLKSVGEAEGSPWSALKNFSYNEPKIKTIFDEVIQNIPKRRLPIYADSSYKTFDINEISSWIVCIVRLTNYKIDRALRFNTQINCTPTQLLADIKRNTKKGLRKGLELNDKENEFVLKHSTNEEYFYGSNKLYEFETVWEVLKTGAGYIDLTLHEVKALALSENMTMLKQNLNKQNYENTRGSHSQEIPSLEEIRNSCPKTTPLKSFEIEHDLKLKIIGVDSFSSFVPIFSTNYNSGSALYNGDYNDDWLDQELINIEDRENHRDKNTEYPKLHKIQRKEIGTFDFEKENKSNSSESYAHLSHGTKYDSFLEALSLKLNFYEFFPYLSTIRLRIMDGNRCLGEINTKLIPFSYFLRWDQTCIFPGLKISNLPINARICAELKIVTDEGIDCNFGNGYLYLFDEGMLRQNKVSVRIWPFYKTQDTLLSMESFNFPDLVDSKMPTLSLSFPSFPAIIYHSRPATQNFLTTPYPIESPSPSDKLLFESILNGDIMLSQKELSTEIKTCIKNCRNLYRSHPMFILAQAIATDWLDSKEVLFLEEILDDLGNQPCIDIEISLLILGPNFTNVKLRRFALQRLYYISDKEFLIYIHHIIQILPYERESTDGLFMLVLKKAIYNPYKLGIPLVINMKAKMLIKPYYEKFATFNLLFAILIDQTAYLEFEKIIKFFNSLKKISKKLKSNEVAAALLIFSNEFEEEQNKNFLNPLNPKLRCSNVSLPNSPTMEPKKRQFLMAFENLSGKNDFLYLVRKNRSFEHAYCQHSLMSFMQIYKLDHLNFDLTINKLLLISDSEVLLECSEGFVSPGSQNSLYGSNFDLLTFMHSRSNTIDFELINNLEHSLIFLMISIFILGIADRHSGNIKISPDGKLASFLNERFLGNISSKYGIKTDFEIIEYFQCAFDTLMNKTQGSWEEISQKLMKYMKLICEKRFFIHGLLYNLQSDPSLNINKGRGYYLMMRLGFENNKENALRIFSLGLNKNFESYNKRAKKAVY